MNIIKTQNAYHNIIPSKPFVFVHLDTAAIKYNITLFFYI